MRTFRAAIRAAMKNAFAPVLDRAGPVHVMGGVKLPKSGKRMHARGEWKLGEAEPDFTRAMIHTLPARSERGKRKEKARTLFLQRAVNPEPIKDKFLNSHARAMQAFSQALAA